MNRTTAFVALAGALVVTAVVAGVPARSAHLPGPAPTPPRLPPLTMPLKIPVPTLPIAQPGSLSLSGRLSHPSLALGTQDLFATLEVTAIEVPGAKRAPVNFALVIRR